MTTVVNVKVKYIPPNYNTLDDFTKLLDKSFTYHFVLIHHQIDLHLEEYEQ